MAVEVFLQNREAAFCILLNSCQIPYLCGLIHNKYGFTK